MVFRVAFAAYLVLGITQAWAQQTVTQADESHHTASDITDRYYDTVRDCGGSGRPAFLCSGVMIRGTRWSPAYHSWDPSPNDHRDGGTSFSWLRQDSKFDRLAYGYVNGVIFYPVFGAPKDKMDPDYLCAFPLDGATDSRNENGCGAISGFPQSAPCQPQGILTGQEWFQAYNTTDQHNGYHACGFDVSDHGNTPGGTAAGFAAVVDAIKLLGSTAFHEQNEIRVKTWDDGLGKTLPIEAFFYIETQQGSGRQSAQNDQVDLVKTAGVWVPVIKMKLPQTSSEDATFHYYSDDQAIPPQ